MRRELHTFEWECDYCKKSEVQRDVRDNYATPKGWGRVQIDDCGMTGYTKYLDACPACLKKHKNK